jgi:hypothetical protein
VYTLTVCGDGTVAYEGRGFEGVPRGRRHRGRIAPAAARRLVDQLVAAGFFDLPRDYTRDEECAGTTTDAASSILTLQRGARRHRIEHYHGCLSDHTEVPVDTAASGDTIYVEWVFEPMPKQELLFRLASLIDSVAATAAWRAASTAPNR